MMDEPVTVVHIQRTVTIEFRRDGEVWHASSPQITGLEAEGPDLAEVQREAVTRLRGWLDPVHRVELRIMDEASLITRHVDHDPELPCRPALGNGLCYPVPAGEQLVPWREVLGSPEG